MDVAIVHGLQDWMFVIIHISNHRASCGSVNIHYSSCSPDKTSQDCSDEWSKLVTNLWAVGLV